MGENTERFATKFAQKYGFDIMSIIELIMSLFENCQQDPAGEVRNPGLFARALVNRKTARAFPDLRLRETRKIAANLMADAAAEPDEEIQGVCGECCSR